MVLVQKLKHSSVEQNRERRNGPSTIWPTNLRQSRKEYSITSVFLTAGRRVDMARMGWLSWIFLAGLGSKGCAIPFKRSNLHRTLGAGNVLLVQGMRNLEYIG